MANIRKRRERLSKPGLQLKVIFMFLVVSVLAVGIQSVLMSRSLGEMMPAGSDSQEAFGLLRENLAVTLAALLPATLLVGVITTFRIAGPLYRFERFLESIERGENPDDCEIRRSDDLHDFCAVLNRVTRPWRTPAVGDSPVGEASQSVEDVGCEDVESLVASDSSPAAVADSK